MTSPAAEESEFFADFARVFYDGVHLLEREWLLFWRFWANSSLRRCFLAAKYVGWEESPKQMVSVVHSDNPLRFYRLSAKKPFYAVVLVGRSDLELDRFLRMLGANSARMETGTFALVSNGLGKDLILKRVTHAEVQAQSYSLANFASFDGLWFLEDNEFQLPDSFDRFGGLLPESLPQIGVVFEKVYEHREQGRLPRVIESLDDKGVVDELKLSSLLRSQAVVMTKSSSGLPPDFVRRHQQNPLAGTGPLLLGLGVAGALLTSWLLWSGKKPRK